MKHAHVIITSFCYRRSRVSKLCDPLNPIHLEKRLNLLKLVNAASISRQSDQRFSWVILIDPLLPERYRSVLTEICARRPKTFLVEHVNDMASQTLGWLDDIIDTDAEIVTTTILDDDDLLYAGFVADMGRQVTKRSQQLDFFLTGCQQSVQWDLIPTAEAPLGYQKPWRRDSNRGSYPPSAGFSLTCKRRMNTSVKMFNHSRAPIYFGASSPDIHNLRDQLEDRIPRGDSSWEDWRVKERFFWLESDFAAQAVTLNHFANIQVGRLFENLGARQVVNPEAFPAQIKVNRKILSACLDDNRLGVRNLVRTINASRRQALRRSPDGGMRSVWYLCNRLTRNLVGFGHLSLRTMMGRVKATNGQ